MAEERQKRLLIKEYDLICDLTDCKYCEEKDWCSEKDTLTRQEAIERIAKAIFKRDSVLALDIGFEDLIEQKQNVYRDFANVALNALLEVEK